MGQATGTGIPPALPTISRIPVALSSDHSMKYTRHASPLWCVLFVYLQPLGPTVVILQGHHGPLEVGNRRRILARGGESYDTFLYFISI